MRVCLGICLALIPRFLVLSLIKLLCVLTNCLLQLKLETMGVNALGADYRNRTHREAVPGAPRYLPTTVDLGKLQIPELLDASGNEVWSRDAGLFFCNELLYRTVQV